MPSQRFSSISITKVTQTLVGIAVLIKIKCGVLTAHKKGLSDVSLVHFLKPSGGAWVAQSVKRPTSARSPSRSPWVQASRQALGWWLGAWSLFPILFLPLSLPLPRSCSFSIFPKNKLKKKGWKKKTNSRIVFQNSKRKTPKTPKSASYFVFGKN